MKALLKGLVGLLILLLAIFFAGRLILPETLSVERHVVIAAPPEKIFAVISNLRRFNDWSPWAAIDPKAVYKFEGPESGVGQKLTWTSSNPAVGNGAETVTAVVENQRVASVIEFAGKGMAALSMDLAPVDKGTGVTWSFNAPIEGTLARWIVYFFPSNIEGDLGKGLRQLKALVEQPAT